MTINKNELFTTINNTVEKMDPRQRRQLAVGSYQPEEQAMTALDLAAGLFKFEQIIDYDYGDSPNEVGMTLPNGQVIFLVSTGTRYVLALLDEERGIITARYDGFIEDMPDTVEAVIRKHGQ